MTMTLKDVRKLNYIDKVVLHCHDQSLYLVSVFVGDEEHYVTDAGGNFLKSFKKLDLQSKFAGLTVGKMVLRHESPYDEMIGLSEGKVDNALEVPIGGQAYGAQRSDDEALH